MSATASTSPPPTEPLALEGEGLASTLATRPAPSARPMTQNNPMHVFGAKTAAPLSLSLEIIGPTPLAAPITAAPKTHAAGLAPAALPGSHRAPGTKPQAERRGLWRPAAAFSEKMPAAEGLEAAAPRDRLPPHTAHTSQFFLTTAQTDPYEEILEVEKTEVLQEALADDDVGAGAGAGATSLRRPSRLLFGPANGVPAASKPSGMATGALFQACAELRRRAHTPPLRVSAAAHFVSLCLTATPGGAASWADLRAWAALYGFTEGEVSAAVGWVEGVKEGVFLAPPSEP